MDETPAPATLADQAADVWGGVYSSVESVWTWFESIGLVNQLGVVAAVLAILGAVWWIIRLPFRRAQQRREAAEKARQLEEAKAEAEQARQDREALRRQMEDNRRASDDKLGRLETLIADFIARERAEAAAEGRAMDEETVERVEQAALGLGELAPAATERVLTGDESGFDELEALAQQKTSAARQAEAEAADKSRAAARIWIEIGDLAYLNHTPGAGCLSCGADSTQATLTLGTGPVFWMCARQSGRCPAGLPACVDTPGRQTRPWKLPPLAISALSP
ncbi:MAG: hypothetical protein R3C04_06605 [Hyphomonas sp.]